jgi:hypothetical protein
VTFSRKIDFGFEIEKRKGVCRLMDTFLVDSSSLAYSMNQRKYDVLPDEKFKRLLNSF